MLNLNNNIIIPTRRQVWTSVSIKIGYFVNILCKEKIHNKIKIKIEDPVFNKIAVQIRNEIMDNSSNVKLK